MCLVPMTIMFAIFSYYVNLQSIYKMLQGTQKSGRKYGRESKNMFWPKFYHAWYANAQV
jgi:hypothetical protein